MVVSIALEGYGPLSVAAARTTLGALSMLILVALSRRRIPWRNGRLWGSVFPIGVLSTALPFFLLSWGQQYVPSAFAGLTMAALPLFVLPLAHFYSDEPLSNRKLVGVILGFVGAAVLLGPGIFSSTSGDFGALARFACLGAAFSYAVSSVLTRNCPPVDPTVLSAMSLGVGSMILLPVMFLVEGTPDWQVDRSGIAIIFLGVFPTAMATLLRIRVIQSAGSVFLTLVNYQVPLWSMVFGALVLQEVLPLRFFLALALILLGVAISQWNSLKRMLVKE